MLYVYNRSEMKRKEIIAKCLNKKKRNYSKYSNEKKRNFYKYLKTNLKSSSGFHVTCNCLIVFQNGLAITVHNYDSKYSSQSHPTLPSQYKFRILKLNSHLKITIKMKQFTKYCL